MQRAARILVAVVILAGVLAAGVAVGQQKFGQPKTVLHVVALKWTPEATDEQKAAAIDGIKTMAATVPGIKNIWIKPDRVQPREYSTAFAIEFESRAAADAYAEHPAHEEWYKIYMPIRAESRSLQISNYTDEPVQTARALATVPPDVLVLQPAPEAEFATDKVTVRGIATDARAVTGVRVAGRVAAMQPRSERAMEFWLEDVALVLGDNEIEIVAKNVDGAEARTVVKVRRVQTAAKPPVAPGLTLEQIVRLLAAGVTPVRVETIVKERGVNFTLTEELESTLRDLGANDALLLAISKAKK